MKSFSDMPRDDCYVGSPAPIATEFGFDIRMRGGRWHRSRVEMNVIWLAPTAVAIAEGGLSERRRMLPRVRVDPCKIPAPRGGNRIHAD